MLRFQDEKQNNLGMLLTFELDQLAKMESLKIKHSNCLKYTVSLESFRICDAVIPK